jgi:hypothetical protein
MGALPTVNIVSQDVANGIATITFSRDNITFTDTYNLIMVIPDLRLQLQSANLSFDANMQSNVISTLTTWMAVNFDNGLIKSN